MMSGKPSSHPRKCRQVVKKSWREREGREGRYTPGKDTPLVKVDALSS